MQRITLVFVALLCCCSIVATFLIWRAIDNSQQATAALVAQVQKLAEREESTAVPEEEWLKYVDWIPVKANLLYENGEPVTDPEFTVNLSGGGKLLGENSMTGQLEEHPDSTGQADFGLVKPGDLQLSVTTPWGEYCYRSLMARVGKPVEQTIICPQHPKSTEAAAVQMEWPQDLRDQQLWVQFILSDMTERDFNGDKWAPSFREHHWSVILSPDGQIYRGWLKEQPKDALRYWGSGGFGGMFDGSYQNNTSATTFTVEALEHFVLGTPVTDPSKILGLNAYGSRVDQPYMGGNRDLVTTAFHEAMTGVLHADLEEQIEHLELPATGVQITTLRVLRKADDPDNELTVFQNVLPIAMMNDPRILLRSPEWSYEPSDRIIELVRKRLEQIEMENKPEAAEVSAELN